MQSPQKGFQLENDSHIITTTYQPSHIDFRVIDKRTNCIKNGKFYDSTLPQIVKEECEAVADLFEYLQGRSASEVQVEGNSLKFKVVRIKKERWYSLDIEDQLQAHSQINAEEKHDQEMEIESEDPWKAIIQMNESLKDQNQVLRCEVQKLNAANKQLLQKLQSRCTQQFTQKMEENQVEEEKQEELMIKQEIQTEQPSIRKLILSNAFENQHYWIDKENDVVEKILPQSKVLIFQECIKKGQKGCFSIQLLGKFYKNWVIFGVMTKQGQYQNNFLMSRGCIAYSGSVGSIFIERDTIDINKKLGKGDRMRLLVDCIERKIEWFVNDALVCTHSIGIQISEKNLHPYLVLSSIGDAVRLNCDN